MTAELLAFPLPASADDASALLAAAVELHALISIDPVMGASPSRVYFVFNPQARRRIAEAIDGACERLPTAFAVASYDFPFALHLIEIAGPPPDPARAKAIATASANLQGEALAAAAAAMGVEALPVAAFDAEALKSAFFPQTQETVTHLFRLELQSIARRSRTPGIAQP